MIEVDLREAVPKPPDDLLEWSSIQHGIAQRRRRRAVTVILTTIAVVATVVITATTVGSTSHTSRPAPITPTIRDNGLIAFARKAPGVTTELKDSSLYTVNPDGSGARRLTRNAGDIAEAAASPDGARVAYVQEVYRHQHVGYVAHDALRVVDIASRADHVVYRCRQTCDSLAWSPNGATLAFNDLGLKLLGPDGIRSVCVGECPASDVETPTWSPDGRQVAFVRAVRIAVPHGTTSVSAIWVADRDGQNVHQLTDQGCKPDNTNCTIDASPIWSPTGQRIAFTRLVPGFLRLDGSTGLNPTGPTGVFTMDPAGHRVHEVWACPKRYFCTLRPPQWSPPGDRLAFVQGLTQFRTPHYGGTAVRSVVVVNTHTGHTSILARSQPPIAGNTTIAWSPDGKQLAVVEHYLHKPNQVYDLPLATLVSLQLRRVAPYGPVLWLPKVSSGRSHR